ncbi:MAG: rRNA maturation RNase YbeY [Bacillota bacterium]|nr:rRNA maturation RNase YbeY [Bacillota bacterium]
MIYIENGQDEIDWNSEHEALLNEIIDFALREENVEGKVQISVVLVNNEEIREINREHRNIDRVTDVLSFPMLDYPDGKVFKEVYKDSTFDAREMDGEELVLGDIVLSLERACEQRLEYGHSFKRELTYLVVHSVLHLLGYDHMKEQDKIRMREREEFILSRFDINRD